MTIKTKLKRWWCGLAHGGGVITRDPEGRINWQCSKCGRWSDSIPLSKESLMVDEDIRKAREVKP
jgi:hypothetical protein